MRQGCRSCWDPVDRDGAELCDWCAATQEQRRKKANRSLLLVVAMIAVLVGLCLAEVLTHDHHANLEEKANA